MSYKDMTFCISRNCDNSCGRKLTEEDKKKAIELGLPISVALFCGTDLFGETKSSVNAVLSSITSFPNLDKQG